ncbi:MAG: helix-turn-helix domain-containing protein [Myxococcota bacterium]
MEQAAESHDLALHPCLLVMGPGLRRFYELTPGRDLVIGRSPECEIQLVHPMVSRRHAVVRAKEEAELEDLGGLNGSSIGDLALTPFEPVPFEDGDEAHIGPFVLRVLSPELAERERCLADPGAARVLRRILSTRRSHVCVVQIELLRPAESDRARQQMARELVTPETVVELFPGKMAAFLSDRSAPVEEVLAVAMIERLEQAGIRVVSFGLLRAAAGSDPNHVLEASAESLSAWPPERGALKMQVEAFERGLIQHALEQSAGNQTLAAARLGVARRTLINRLEEYALARPRQKTTPGLMAS